jgi:divalent metal cation (Fe/Co/Zn/Cd) transporter
VLPQFGQYGQLLGWWWADRITAIIVASVAGTEAWRTIPFSKGG